MAHDSQHPHPKRKSRSFGLTCSVLLGMTLGLIFFAGLTIAASFFYFQGSDLILPGTKVLGLDIGAMPAVEAQQALAANWQSKPPVIMLTTGDQAWPVSATELGLGLESNATAREALALGREGDLPIIGQALWGGVELEPVLTFAPDVARANLEKWSSQVSVPAQDAGFKIEHGQVVSVPSQSGQALDVEATFSLLSSNPNGIVHTGRLPIILRPVAPAVSDVSAAIARVSQLLATPLTVNVYDAISDEWYVWNPAPEVVAGWLSVDATQTVVVVSDRVSGYISEQSQMLGPDRFVDAAEAADLITNSLGSGDAPTLIVHHHPTTYTIQAGDNLTRIGFKVGMPYWYIVQANPGLDTNGIVAGQVITIPSKDEMLPLPVVPNKRVVVSISQQRAWAFENRQQIREYIISTGIDSSPTQPGIFQVQLHDINAYASVWDLWMPHFLGIYEPWPGFFNGFHGLPTLSSGVRLWANVLGRPASYGCIILTLDDAEQLYNWAEDGVVVEIRE
jgi:LysM repeat protein